MNKCAKHVMGNFKDIIMAYGQSDEFSFVFKKHATLFNRRGDKILSTVVSAFSSAYIFHWNNYFKDLPLAHVPMFDGRVVLYPSLQELKSYLSWRQVDCHVNNLYNTTFWALNKQGGKQYSESHERLKGTHSKDKHEILF